MRKIIAVFALALLFVQCTEEPMPSNKPVVPSFSAKKTAPKWPLFVTKNAVAETYGITNENVIFDSDSLYYYVDLSLENDVSTIVKWLQDNDRFVDYPASYQNIEASHKIDVTLYPQVLLIPSTSFKDITLSDIKTAVEDAGGVFGDHFQYFLSFSIKNGQVTVMPAPYVQNGTCYSMPLLNSIVANNRLKKTDVKFQFTPAVINNQNTLIFRVKNTEGNYMYYDFSNNPPIR